MTPLQPRLALVSRIRGAANTTMLLAGLMFLILLLVGRDRLDPAWVGRVGLVALLAFLTSVVAIAIENRLEARGGDVDTNHVEGGPPR